jgi:hypothetical protein
MTTTHKKRPRDPVQFAKLIGDIATGQTPDAEDDGKDAAMSELGRQGGLKGGRGRAAKLSPDRRQEIAKAAAAARWRTSDEE